MNEQDLLKLYEPQPDGELLYERQLWQARFSPCGEYLVAGGYDATVQRWKLNADGIAPLPALPGHHGWVQCIGFHPDGRRLFTADSWGQLSCWEYAVESPAPQWSLPQAHPGWIRALAVSADGTCVATGGSDPTVRIWSPEGKQLQELAGHSSNVFSVCFHPDGKSLVTGDLLGKIRHWDLATGKVVRELDASLLYQLDRIQQCGGARQLAFNREGTQLLCAGQKNPKGGFATGLPCVLLFDWAEGKVLHELQQGANDEGFVYDAQFHRDGFVMAASSAFPGKGQLWFWKPGDPKPFFVGKNLTNGRSLSFHPDGQRAAYLVSLSTNGNGRQLKDGKYPGGSAKIHLLKIGNAA